MTEPSITLISVNVGMAERLPDGKPTKTGINKRPTEQRVSIVDLGIEGDAICNLKHHGGLDQAIYFYSRADYDWWENKLGKPCAAGLFGENFTVDGPKSAEVCIGDRFTVGDVVLETTSPRIPCNTLNRRMDDPKFGAVFRQAERPGWYCRVLQRGVVQVNNPVTLEPFDGERIDMAKAMRDYYLRKRVPLVDAQRYLATPAHEKTHRLMREILGSAS